MQLTVYEVALKRGLPAELSVEIGRLAEELGFRGTSGASRWDGTPAEPTYFRDGLLLALMTVRGAQSPYFQIKLAVKRGFASSAKPIKMGIEKWLNERFAGSWRIVRAGSWRA